LKQCDTAWGSAVLGSSTTVCSSGCTVCSIASALSGLGKKVGGVTPTCGNLNTWLKANGGFSGNAFVWTSVSSYGLIFETNQQTSIASIKTAICANKIVILNVNQGGHWVLAKSYSGDVFTVMDPGYAKTTYAATEVTRASIYRV
jgi:hypothetical protein